MKNNTEITSIGLLLEFPQQAESRVLPDTNIYLRQSVAGVLLALLAAFFFMLETTHAQKQVSTDSPVMGSRSESAASINGRHQAEQIDSSERQAFQHASSEKTRTWSLSSDDWNGWLSGSNGVWID